MKITFKALSIGTLGLIAFATLAAPAHALVGAKQWHATVTLQEIQSGATRPSNVNVYPSFGVDFVRQNAGRYKVRFLGSWDIGSVGVTSGNVQVTALGFDNRRCNVSSWTKESTWWFVGHVAYIICTKPNGTADADSGFTISFVHSTSSTDTSAPSGYISNRNSGKVAAWNSTGGSTSLVRAASGRYTVAFGGLGAFGGTVQVTANTSPYRHCKVVNWSPIWTGSSFDMQINVRCFNTAGNLANSDFSLVYEHGAKGPTGKGAHVWARDVWSSGSAPQCYTPNTSYDFNSERSSSQTLDAACQEAGNVFGGIKTGSYFILHEPLSSSRSVARVTAYGSGSEYCKLEAVNPILTNKVEVRTLCFDRSGNPKNTTYIENYITWR